MEWRGPVVLVALVALGVGGGYAVSVRDGSGGSGVADPVAADGPGLPVDPPAPERSETRTEVPVGVFRTC